MTILVTGGTGKRGSLLCRKLVKQGKNVVCVDDNSVGWSANLGDAMDYPNLRFIRSKVENIDEDKYVGIEKIYDLTPSDCNKSKIKKIAQNNGCIIKYKRNLQRSR